MICEGLMICERTASARTNGASTPSPKRRQAARWPVDAFGEVAAYGEVVWSWHSVADVKLAEMRRPDRAWTNH